MTEQEHPTETEGFRDRMTGLIIFGLIQLCFGSLCALLVPLMVLGMAMTSSLAGGSAPGVTMASMIPAVVMYSLLAAWFISMGIGSIFARRWARALVLVSSWTWLVIGVVALLGMAFVMPGMFDQMAKDGQMPQEMVLVMTFFVFAFMTVLYVVVPGAHILFYGSKHVKATCEFRNAQICWTDKCPLPVLALSLLSGFGALSMPSMGLYGWVFPFFGIVLNGTAGAAAVLVSMALLVYIAWGSYKLKMGAWWACMFLIVAGTVSSIITFSRVSMSEYYEMMNFSAQQLEMMEQYSFVETTTFIPFFGLSRIVYIGYLLYVRKYFLTGSKNVSLDAIDSTASKSPKRDG